jgi:RNA polymerase sigma-70 factor (ECF subfamily)
LLERVKAKDDHAWRFFLALYEPLVRYWCRGSGLRDEDASDVVQEVFAVVARSIGAYRHDRPGDTFRGWLRTIAHSRIVDLRRRKGRLDDGEGGSDALDRMREIPAEPAGSWSSDEDDRRVLVRRAVELVLGTFEENSRRAFLRVVLNEEHPVDVAQDLGISANAVYLATSRIKRKLRQEFAELIEI